MIVPVIVPAMNEGMWNHPTRLLNAGIVEHGVQFIALVEGWQACRTVGVGRMSEAGEVVEWVGRKLSAGGEAVPGHFVP